MCLLWGWRMSSYILELVLQLNSDGYVMLSTVVEPWQERDVARVPYVWQQDSAPCHIFGKCQNGHRIFFLYKFTFWWWKTKALHFNLGSDWWLCFAYSRAKVQIFTEAWLTFGVYLSKDFFRDFLKIFVVSKVDLYTTRHDLIEAYMISF